MVRTTTRPQVRANQPIWAALTAILNQNLAANGHAPLGLPRPKLYPFAGTGAMNYVTQGHISYLFSTNPSFWGSHNGPFLQTRPTSIAG